MSSVSVFVCTLFAHSGGWLYDILVKMQPNAEQFIGS